MKIPTVWVSESVGGTLRGVSLTPEQDGSSSIAFRRKEAGLCWSHSFPKSTPRLLKSPLQHLRATSAVKRDLVESLPLPTLRALCSELLS